MLFLADTSESLATVEKEIGCEVGQLLTPLNGLRNRAVEEGRKWAFDNGAFSGFNRERFLTRLKGQDEHRKSCLFVVAVDIVGNARRTLDAFRYWGPWLRSHKWPVALAAQDGLEDLDIPWDDIDCLFVGGSTEWKLSDHARDCILTAQALGKWVHIGRINTPERLDRFKALGADSYDGSGISRFSHMRRKIKDGLPLLQDGM